MSTGQPSWIDRPMRWGQLALVDNDPGRYDMAFWLDYFRKTHVDGVCLSAGGCVAFYPTKVPLHHRCKWMGEGDPFGDLVKACRQMNLVIVARTDPHACHHDVFENHPDWIAVDADGNPRRHWAHKDYWVTCTLGPYAFDFMTRVTREIMDLYRPEGIFCNRWAGSGMCYCRHCRDGFYRFSGLDLPGGDKPDDPAHRQYLIWKQQRLFELWRLWDGEIRAVNPDSCFIPNVGGGALSELDMAQVGRLAPMHVADRPGRSGSTPLWVAGKNGKEYRAALGNKPHINLFSVGIEEPHRWKDSVQSNAELRLFVADGIAQGLRPWYTKFCGVLHDRRWLDTVQRIFQWHHANEKYLRNTANLARVGLVYSQQTAHFYGGRDARHTVEDHICGFYHALVEARIPFEMVHDRLLDPEHLSPFKVLLLPNIAALSDQQCQQLRDYVAAGGSILATHETSLYDEWGRRRSDFCIGDLLGVSVAGSVQGPMKNAYLRLEHPHPVLAGLEDAPRIIHGVHRLPVRPAVNFPDTPVTLIPPYPDLPMEEVYPRVERTITPELFLRHIGAGRIAYFNWDIDRTFWQVLCPDHGRLLANVVHWAANEPPPVTVTGQGLIDIAVWRQEKSMTVHLVNLTNPMLMRGPCRQLIPSPPQHVSIRLPDGARASKVHLLVANTTPDTVLDGPSITLPVPSILDHEVIAVELDT